MPGMNLTREETAARAALLSVESYAIELDVTGTGATFRSTTLARFRCAEPGAETWIDLVADGIQEAVLNGTPLDTAALFDGTTLRLPGLAEDNELRVVADCTFMRTGEGLHRFVDPVDGETYLYSQFEVADSRRMFAVFEQPDLKATYQLTVTAPAHWQVVSVSPTPEPEPAADGAAVWRFAPTSRLSSYVTALVAGPYAVVRGEVGSRKGSVPANVYCRRTLAEFLDAEEILRITQQGFDFYEELFDLAYPFHKYDQLFVPEFNAGAMENAGCVTILEDYVFRSRVSEASVERRAITILHELAHMWFGDLVTMKWWNDLWLNESFAEFVSHVAAAEATSWTDAWTTFVTTEKTWAYRQDQLPSTHPIVAEINDLEDVEVNFDGITYAKGASVLKQLVAYVGREAFFSGIRTYFTTHAYANTTLHDLLVELERASGRDLSTWSALWLETAGVATLRPELTTAADDTFTSFSVLQEVPEQHPTLRPHRLGIGLYDLGEGGLTRRRYLEVDVDGASTPVPELFGEKRPDLLLLNDEDLAFAKVRLDDRSVQTLVAHIDEVAASLPRALCWGAAWDMCRDAEMRPRDYLRLVVEGIGSETDSSMLRTVLRQAEVVARLYVEPSFRQRAAQVLADGLQNLARQAAPGSDAQLQLVRAAAAAARTPEQLAFVAGLYDGTHQLEGLAVDTDLRWDLLHRLVAGGERGPEAVDAELVRDRTATGERHAAAARAAQPTAEAKAAAWESVVERDDLPNSLLVATIGGFAEPGQEELVAPYTERYFDALERVWAARTNETAQSIVVGLFPTLLADAELLARTDSWLAEHAAAPSSLRRLVLESRDGVARALRAQQRDAQD
ncbi:membrane alanyl aminopeptidase [Motilibacter rhizosphaerae]|uniref:Aminopeptidase N n=1 Tax=Motilibacter rhizosphaerae TaxID=598652 RepID=A0A4Q7NRW3_9ACTN|nr:aminopeptidase N [Motilibacter rhizosphaerae]RZS89811.1 membrane alanyl aminopeptidase [Motilibacter rhizosphaerae]